MSFPKYPKYKQSGVEWLGDVPENWEISRLGFESWVRARLGWKGLKADEYVDDGFAFLSTPNIKGKEIDFENVNFIDQHRFDESPEIILREGDVLLAKDGSTLGTVNIVRTLPRPTTVNSSIAVITPNSRLAGVFLYYLFETSYMEHTIQRIKGGMGVPHLFQADLNKFYLPLPSHYDQILIASFLDRETSKIDALVGEKRRLIELLKEKRQAVISHAVTKGLNPNAPLKPSGIEWLGDVPEHWEVTPLKHLCILLKDGTHLPPERVDVGVPLLSVRNLVEGEFVLRDDDSMISEEDYHDLCRAFVPNEDDVLLAIVGATLGKTAIVPTGLGPFHIQRSLAIFRTRSEVVCPSFLNLVFQSHPFQSLLWELVGYSAQPGIYLGTLQNLRIPVPALEEQLRIVELISARITELTDLTAEAERGIELLQERRTALISAAVTGKIDIRGFVTTEASR